MPLHRLYYRITSPKGEVHYFSGMDTHRSPQKTLNFVRRHKAREMPGYTYVLCPKEEYQAYWDEINRKNREFLQKQREEALKDG